MRSEYEVEVLSLEMCGSDVISARFTRPPGWGFTAGQWIVLTLPGGNPKPLSKTFTVCSAPSDDYLEITTRVSNSEYKRRLAALIVGERVTVSGPGGRLALPVGARRLAFLVGGVGITPVRSMLRQACSQGSTFDDAVVFYGNRDDSCVPFEAELEAMAGCGVRVVPCFEHPRQGWVGERGFVTAEMVRRHLPAGVDDRPFIVAGPPQMVEAMVAVLDALGVSQERRLIERFGTTAASSGLGEIGRKGHEAHNGQ